MTDNLRSPERELIELRMEHADLDAAVDRLAHEQPVDELALRDQIARLENLLDPAEPA